jgi:hypothetical protein
MIPMFELLDADKASLEKANTFLECVDHTINAWGMIVSGPHVVVAMQRKIHVDLWGRLKIVGYKTTVEDWTANQWRRFFAPIEVQAAIFLDHETSLASFAASPADDRSMTRIMMRDYRRFVQAYRAFARASLYHYPGIIRDERPPRQRIYGGLSIAAAMGGATVVDSSLGYAKQNGAAWEPLQSSVSMCLREAIRAGAYGAEIAPMLYTRTPTLAGWPMGEFPRLENEFRDKGYADPIVHLGFSSLIALGEQWVSVFEGAN